MSPDLDLLVSLCNLDFPTPLPSKDLLKGGSNSVKKQAKGSTSMDEPQIGPAFDQNQASEMALEGATADRDGVHAEGGSDPTLEADRQNDEEGEAYKLLDEDNPEVHQKVR